MFIAAVGNYSHVPSLHEVGVVQKDVACPQERVCHHAIHRQFCAPTVGEANVITGIDERRHEFEGEPGLHHVEHGVFDDVDLEGHSCERARYIYGIGHLVRFLEVRSETVIFE